MDSAQNNALKLQIRDRITTLEDLLAPGKNSKSSNDASANLNENIASAVDSQVRNLEKQELTWLKRNLIWLDSGDAGFCRKCDCEISFARLQAVPVTQLCINCAS